MPRLALATGRRAVRTLTHSQNAVLARNTTATARRPFSQTKATRAGDHGHGHGESFYDPPGGWLFGRKPGEPKEREGWEPIMYYIFFPSLLLGVVGYAFKPDTSIQTWALEEARRRLEAEGILPDPDDEKKE
ncbi:hypothetical protein K491DRAFT_681895 [Lophiostoma macrostomum CBS 122681]|uniref:NADH dehydrogenase [ubiquinone] 1 beta subcomplex subunit 11, mitochondrial n=1 Tax=Lophiostoma macrostomum CBS 122681 TaxID=1314788 RepID=A0A6A6SVV9_9PLEO|nr:hypothetical protein K491DRAFT_681895 [Lophiostoma macrostomum CBS 122681]